MANEVGLTIVCTHILPDEQMWLFASCFVEWNHSIKNLSCGRARLPVRRTLIVELTSLRNLDLRVYGQS